MKFLWRQPLDDLLGGLDSCLAGDGRHRVGGVRSLLWIFIGLVVGWWIYVPLHELLHAAGCVATGGTVERLELSPLYGGILLAQLFSFVEEGGEYAGRLSGFDTAGSDAIYLATDLAPFILTLPGVWLLLESSRRARCALFGASLPFALAPFLSLTGDAYEIGSIVTTWLPPWQGNAATLRGDDIFFVAQELDGSSWGGFALALIVGVLWAFGTYALCRWLIVWGEELKDEQKSSEQLE